MSRDLEHTVSIQSRRLLGGGVMGVQTDSCCRNRGFDAEARSNTYVVVREGGGMLW